MLKAASEPSSTTIPVDDEATSEPLGKAVQEKAKVALPPAKSAPVPTNSAAKPALVRAVTDPVTVAVPGRAKCLVEVKVKSVTLSNTHPPGPDDGQRGSSERKLGPLLHVLGRQEPSLEGGCCHGWVHDCSHPSLLCCISPALLITRTWTASLITRTSRGSAIKLQPY